jgi:hypothetical protein
VGVLLLMDRPIAIGRTGTAPLPLSRSDRGRVSDDEGGTGVGVLGAVVNNKHAEGPQSGP